MDDWAGGYTTDVDYTYGFYQALSPPWLDTVCRLRSVPERPGPRTYLELGCGQGYNLNLLAAACPQDTFFGVDLLPAHVAGASHLAAQAGLANVIFLERTFEQLAEDAGALPACDMIALHGVYTWVGPEQRAAIRAIIRQKLRPGGVVYISYNCMPGWGPLQLMQKVTRDFVVARGGGKAAVTPSFDALKRYRDAGLAYFNLNPAAGKWLDSVGGQHRGYLSHEYFNAHWTPYYFQDLSKEMAECRCAFVSSAQPANGYDKFSMADDVAALVRSEPDPDLREFLRDLAANRRFRADVFVRGVTRNLADRQTRVLADTRFALVKPRADIEMKVQMPVGMLQLGKAVYGRFLDKLELGPARIGDVLDNPTDMIELIIVLMQSDWARPVAEGVRDGTAARRLNEAITAWPSSLKRYNYAASPLLGSAILIPPKLRAAYAAALRQPGIDAAALQMIVDGLRGNPAYDGLIDSTAEGDQALPPRNVLREHLALWRNLQIVG